MKKITEFLILIISSLTLLNIYWAIFPVNVITVLVSSFLGFIYGWNFTKIINKIIT